MYICTHTRTTTPTHTHTYLHACLQLSLFSVDYKFRLIYMKNSCFHYKNIKTHWFTVIHIL